MKLVIKRFLFNLTSIINDPTVQLVYIVKTVVLQIGRGLLTTNTARTLEQNLAVLLTLKLF